MGWCSNKDSFRETILKIESSGKFKLIVSLGKPGARLQSWYGKYHHVENYFMAKKEFMAKKAFPTTMFPLVSPTALWKIC